jgi:hypothetical protein
LNTRVIQVKYAICTWIDSLSISSVASTAGLVFEVAAFLTTVFFTAGTLFSSLVAAFVVLAVFVLRVARVVAVAAVFAARVRLVVADDVAPVTGVPTRAEDAPFGSATFLERVAMARKPGEVAAGSKGGIGVKSDFDRAILQALLKVRTFSKPIVHANTRWHDDV